MTTAHDVHPPHAVDADHPSSFDGEPVQELPADEPATRGWVPLLGAALFSVAGLYALSSGGGPEVAAPEPAPTAQAAAPAPAPAPTPFPVQQQPRPLPRPPQAPSAAAAPTPPGGPAKPRAPGAGVHPQLGPAHRPTSGQ